jgi:hypothetical protein
MTMARADAISYIASEFAALIRELRLKPDDSPAGFKYSIDAAFRICGNIADDLSTATTTSTADDIGFQALLGYTALRRLERAAAARSDLATTDPGIKKTRSQVYKQVHEMRLAAEQEIASFGYASGDQMTSVRVNLDFLEPLGYVDYTQ